MKDAKTKKQTEEGARSFAVFLAKIDAGAFEGELSAELQALGKALSDAVYETESKAKAEMTIKLSFEHDADRVGTIRVKTDVKSKLPKVKKSAPGTFWLTRGNNFDHKHPYQQELPLRQVEAPESARDLDLDDGGETTKNVRSL